MILNYYNGIYDPELWVATEKDMNSIKKLFYAYKTIHDLNNDTDGEVIEISRPFGGVTYAVRHRKKNIVGILIILNSAYLDKDRYSYLVNTISHESVHAADMVFQYIGQFTEDFDSRNEPYAYLVGWIAGCVGDYLTKYFKENGSEEV